MKTWGVVLLTIIAVIVVLLIIGLLFWNQLKKFIFGFIFSPELNCWNLDKVFKNININCNGMNDLSKFNLDLAKDLIKVNLLSYGLTCGYNDPSDFTNAEYIGVISGRSREINLTTTEPYIYIWKCNNNLIVSIRGTLSNEGWMSDAMFKTESSKIFNNNPSVLVHRGFNRLYESMRHKLLAIINHMLKDGSINNIVIIGHSLGASLALLASYDIVVNSKLSNNESLVVYTIGCPRTGNKEFAVEMEKVNNFRIQNMADIIPQVPPPSVYGNEFSHTFPVLQFKDWRTTISYNHTPYIYLQGLNRLDKSPYRYLSEYSDLDA